MTPETHALIKEATSGLKLIDVFLFDASFDRPNRTPSEVSEVRVQNRKEVAASQGQVEHGGRKIELLQIAVQLGVAVVPDVTDPALQDEPVLAIFKIEAQFLVNYEMTKDLREEAIKAFADYNAVHNVWPFWRQHVYDIVARGRLPAVDIPLYSELQGRPPEEASVTGPKRKPGKSPGD